MTECLPESGFVVPDGTSEYAIRVTRLTVLPPTDRLFDERATDVEIVDEAAGEFVVITQKSGHVGVKAQQIQISKEEWPALRSAVESMVSECRE